METLILDTAYAHAQSLMPFGDCRLTKEVKPMQPVYENKALVYKLKRLNHCYTDGELEAVLPLTLTSAPALKSKLAEEVWAQPRPPVANRKPWPKLSLSARRKILTQYIQNLNLGSERTKQLLARKDIADAMPRGLLWDKTNAIIDGIDLAAEV